ncbi:MAG: hypothetical protein MUQ65_08145 [Armatimonadetes bacterium]|nr:hypothetical protein [Armatimonadota bacterium]
MEWFREVQFVAAVPMPVEWAREYGTTVNGMWDDPTRWGTAEVKQAHAEGRRVLVSVPLIALTARAYEQEQNRHLLEHVCRDVFGNEAEVKWYYWDSKPVYAICLYSRVFRNHLLAKIQKAIEAGADVISVDEIQTSIGLMSRERKDPGFCPKCLEEFCAHLDSDSSAQSAAGVADVGDLRSNDYSALLQRLREDDAFYGSYVSFHEQAAYQAVEEFLSEIRSAIAAAGSEMAVTANLTGLGTFLETQGSLWGAAWGELIDFVLMENLDLLSPGTFQEGRAHWLLPRGKFAAWYRLASSFSSKAPAWLTPQINVPRELAGKPSLNYYLLMFLESYANNGRWGYYWWPGVDERTRLEATVPEAVKDYTRFIVDRRQYYEELTTDNDLLVLYANSAVLENRKGHFKYLGLAQALAESGFQYDVLYDGDDIFTPGDIATETLRRYRAVLVAEAGHLTPKQTTALKAYAEQGGQVIAYSANELGAHGGITTIADDRLLDFWNGYRPEDRKRIVEPLSELQDARIQTSDDAIGIVRYRKGDEHICHVLNHDYRHADDSVVPKDNVKVVMSWAGETRPTVRWLTLEGEQTLQCNLDGNRLSFTIPKVDPYGLAIVS